jgi:hypothetical protein
LLDSIAGLWGPQRVAFLEDEKKYIITWFMKHKSAPPIEIDVLRENLIVLKAGVDKNGNPDGTFAKAGLPPLRIRFLAEALRYVADIIETMDEDTLEILVEAKVEASWLQTKPKTTVDLIIRDAYIMHVLDLKMGDIEVSPIRNSQLMYYGLTFDADQYVAIRLHIIQRNHTDYWDVDLETLEQYKTKVLTAEQAIIDGDLTLTPGSHCTFCPANPHARGDKGNKACPAMMLVLYGEREASRSDEEILDD